VDLFEPGSGAQVHDNNGGLLASGLFWTLPVDDDELRAATAPAVDRGKGGAVAPTDPAAFLARFAVAQSTAAFTGSEFGFSFRSNPRVSTARTRASSSAACSGGRAPRVREGAAFAG
jgi:hypothetical protein